MRSRLSTCERQSVASSPIYPRVDRFPEDVPRHGTHTRIVTESWQTTDVSLLVYPYKRGGERANRDVSRGGAKRKKKEREPTPTAQEGGP